MDLTDQRLDLERDGYIAIADLLTEQEVAWYLECYESIMSGRIDAGQWRSDLGSGHSQKREGVENITQVMWPSELIPDGHSSAAYQHALGITRQLLGDDMAFDFDILIDKAPGTDTPTPFHQDMAYWVDLPDRRAVSCWIALDEATVDNGCMWFAPGSQAIRRLFLPNSPACSMRRISKMDASIEAWLNGGVHFWADGDWAVLVVPSHHRSPVHGSKRPWGSAILLGDSHEHPGNGMAAIVARAQQLRIQFWGS